MNVALSKKIAILFGETFVVDPLSFYQNIIFPKLSSGSINMIKVKVSLTSTIFRNKLILG
jgi:hypothetical protein